MKIFSSREFNQDVSQAKRFAANQPVFVTDRGRPTHVLMSIAHYRDLVGKSDTIVDLLHGTEPVGTVPDWRVVGPWARKA